MVPVWVVVAVSAAYLALLFAVAAYADRRAARGRSLISSGVVYALSLGVYATSWTYYGSVGRAASSGVGFLPIYLGPTVAMAVWWLVVRRIIRICKRDRITSLSDFLAVRYGNRAGLGALVTVVAVVGILPYIALQLKAISTTFDILRAPASPGAPLPSTVPLLEDSALYVALLLAAFTIVFGTRRLDASERHEGMVAAIAVESLVKLGALLAVGGYVVYGLFDGFGDVFARAAAAPETARLLTFEAVPSHGSWMWLVVLSMLAILLLPRQWQVSVVENVDERHLRTASWLFPLYLLAANVFVLPIALAGLLTFSGEGVDPDTFVLALPLADGRPGMALLVFVGGLSAATGMVIVETIALSTMVSNSLVLPVLLRRGGALARRSDLSGTVLAIRRVTIVVLLLLGFITFRAAGEGRALVSIGLVSFAAVAQFAPALLGGLFWRGASRRGATAGILGGTAVWAYTMLLPAMSESGWPSATFVQDGPFGFGLLAPRSLLGLDGLDEVSHTMTWSMLVNVGLLVGLSLSGRRDADERLQAARFVDVLSAERDTGALGYRGTATVADLQRLLERFLGPARTDEELTAWSSRSGRPLEPAARADPELVQHAEALLAGAVGSTSARFVVSAAADEEPLGVPEVMEILDETSQVLATSRALEVATAELRTANEQLQELDRLKDDFISTVTHELRTPLTSIRAFSEILLDNPELDADDRQGFLRTVVDETARLTRLINQVLDLSKLESGLADWQIEPVDLRAVVLSSTDSVAQLLRDRDVGLSVELPDAVPAVRADRDRLVQVLVNLLSNAAKFAPSGTGEVRVALHVLEGQVRTSVQDNGPGLSHQDQQVVFEKFRQAADATGERPAGTGLGLPISAEIVSRLGGRLEVSSEPGRGATFSFTLPAETEDG